jgi:hypothetical protein
MISDSADEVARGRERVRNRNPSQPTYLIPLKKRRVTECLLQATGSALAESADESPRELDLQNDRDLTMTCVERLHSDSPLNQSIKNCQSKDSEDKNEDNDDNADSHAHDLRSDYQNDGEDNDASFLFTTLGGSGAFYKSIRQSVTQSL